MAKLEDLGMSAEERKFVNSVKGMERRTRNVSAYVVINPQNPEQHGRFVISHPRDGASRVHAIAWLPGQFEECYRHYGHAGGYGHDKASAAMHGAEFWNLKTGQRDDIKGDGHSTERQQLEDAGYIVIQAV